MLRTRVPGLASNFNPRGYSMSKKSDILGCWSFWQPRKPRPVKPSGDPVTHRESALVERDLQVATPDTARFSVSGAWKSIKNGLSKCFAALVSCCFYRSTPAEPEVETSTTAPPRSQDDSSPHAGAPPAHSSPHDSGAPSDTQGRSAVDDPQQNRRGVNAQNIEAAGEKESGDEEVIEIEEEVAEDEERSSDQGQITLYDAMRLLNRGITDLRNYKVLGSLLVNGANVRLLRRLADAHADVTAVELRGRVNDEELKTSVMKLLTDVHVKTGGLDWCT
jgi:hypothetical protein